jgi:release factor glutamine methyltransferase
MWKSIHFAFLMPSNFGVSSRVFELIVWPVSILEVIQRSEQFLARKGVPSPRLQVELLLADLLKIPRLQLYLNFDRQLQAEELAALRPLVERRGRREPLQYITGATSFCGIEVAVNPHVLVPRPETELLAEGAWKFLNQPQPALAPDPPSTPALANPVPLSALDLGTGSGCLAIALAVNSPQARIHATDISSDALVVAGQNAARHQVQQRIHFHQGDLFAALPHGLRFDLIVSNPPYVPTSKIRGLEPEVRDYEPRAALDGGSDGLDFYRKIAGQAGAFLKPLGRIMLELDDETSQAVKDFFAGNNWIVEPIQNDYQQRPRILIAHFQVSPHSSTPFQSASH